MALKKRERKTPEIPSASMADIAFLLLIFFMVTTTINVDTGIGLVLPPPVDPGATPPPIKKRNILNMLVNASGQVLINDEESSISQIRELTKKHITNNGVDPKFSEIPDKALVSVKVDKGTTYDIYIKVFDEINLAYYDLRSGLARQRFGQIYEKLNDIEKREIDDVYKKKISFAEPEETK